MQVVKTEDGKEFKQADAKLVGSVSAVKSRDVHKPAQVGEFPVFVEQSGRYRLFTYSKKITEIRDDTIKGKQYTMGFIDDPWCK